MKRAAKLTLVAALGAALGCASGAWAQVAPAAPDTATKLDLARRIVAADGGSEQFATTIKSMYGAINANLAKTLPPNQAQTVRLIQTAIESQLISLTPQLVEIGVHAYADNLSQEELRDMLAWETSPSGEAIRSKGPAILQEVLAQELPLITASMPTIMQKAIDRACDEAHCTAQDRQTITAAVNQAMKRRAS